MTLQAMCFQAVPASQVMILGQNAPKSSPKCPKIITWLAADCFKCVPGLQPTASNVCLHIFWTSHLRVRIPYAVDALVHLKRSSRPSLHLLPFCLDKLYVQSGQDRGVTRNRGGLVFEVCLAALYQCRRKKIMYRVPQIMCRAPGFPPIRHRTPHSLCTPTSTATGI